MDLNPSALLPSACNPHIPKTERKDTLKIYGDADVTVSVESVIDDPAGSGQEIIGAFCT